MLFLSNTYNHIYIPLCALLAPLCLFKRAALAEPGQSRGALGQALCHRLTAALAPQCL